MKAKLLLSVTGKQKQNRFHGLLNRITDVSIDEQDIIPLEDDLSKLLENFLLAKPHRPRHREGVVVNSQDIEVTSVYSKLYTPALDDYIYQPGQSVVRSKSVCKQSESGIHTQEGKRQVQNEVKDVFGVISELKQLDLSG